MYEIHVNMRQMDRFNVYSDSVIAFDQIIQSKGKFTTNRPELAHYKRLGMVINEQVEYHIRKNEGIEFEIIRLRKIESAAVAAVEYEQWTGGTFYDLMIDLQKALHG